MIYILSFFISRIFFIFQEVILEIEKKSVFLFHGVLQPRTVNKKVLTFFISWSNVRKSKIIISLITFLRIFHGVT